ncbi:unnamed protein product [Umbelopsis sp. WA50703]
MSLIYGLVAHGFVILAEHTNSTGNFAQVTQAILEKIPPNNSKLTYVYDRYLFHYICEDGLTYMCMADDSFGRRTPFAFLQDIKEKFLATYDRQSALNAPIYGMNEFSKVIAKQMEEYSTNPGANKLKQVHGEIEQVKDVMVHNIERVLERGERIELLVDKTDNLNQQAFAFKKRSTQLKRQMWWKNTKLMVMIAVVCFDILRNVFDPVDARFSDQQTNKERDDLSNLENEILNMPDTFEEEPQQVMDELDELEQQILNANDEDRVSISSSVDEITELEREILNARDTQDAPPVHAYSRSRDKSASKAISTSMVASDSMDTETSTIPVSIGRTSLQSPTTSRTAMRRTIESVTYESQHPDDIFEDMVEDNPLYLEQLSQERKRPKRTLPAFSSQVNTFSNRPINTPISLSSNMYDHRRPSAALHNSQPQSRITDAQVDAVRLTEDDFDNVAPEMALERNVVASESGRPIVSHIRQLPTISLVVGPPDSADEYEWSDSGMTPPTSPEGEAYDINMAPIALSDAEQPTNYISVKPEPNLRTAPPAHRSAPKPQPTWPAPRKIRTMWTGPEIDALEDGLDRVGWGRWAAIKVLHKELLKDRDSVAIKDKARTEANRRQRENIPLGPYCGCPYI